MTRFVSGVAFGKFWPLHAGHLQLIDSMVSRCSRATVVVDDGTEDVPVSVRAQWVRDVFPTAQVVTAPDLCGHDTAACTAECSDRYACWVAGNLGPVDAVFAGEHYGDVLAARLGARSVRFPRPDRRLAGRRIRADLVGHWELLSEPARAWYARRVVVVGAESTGTTTLAAALAAALGTSWVPEYGRRFTEEHGIDHRWDAGDFERIARRQAADEDAAARRSGPVLVCDTDVLATAVWHERYLGTTAPQLLGMAAERRPALYLLTADDIPFVQDGLRDGAHVRSWMTGRFRAVVSASGVPWRELRGPLDRRLAEALACMAAVLGPRWVDGGRGAAGRQGP